MLFLQNQHLQAKTVALIGVAMTSVIVIILKIYKQTDKQINQVFSYADYSGVEEIRDNCSLLQAIIFEATKALFSPLCSHTCPHIHLSLTLHTQLEAAPPGEYLGLLWKGVRQRGGNLGLHLPKLSNPSSLTRRPQEMVVRIFHLLHCLQVLGTQMRGR